MKRIYIQPSVEVIHTEFESDLMELSGVNGKNWKGEDIETGLKIENENDEGVLCSKPTNPDLWGDDEW